MGKTIKEKLKEVEKYICENFDELGIDDPVDGSLTLCFPK